MRTIAKALAALAIAATAAGCSSTPNHPKATVAFTRSGDGWAAVLQYSNFRSSDVLVARVVVDGIAAFDGTYAGLNGCGTIGKAVGGEPIGSESVSFTISR